MRSRDTGRDDVRAALRHNPAMVRLAAIAACAAFAACASASPQIDTDTAIIAGDAFAPPAPPPRPSRAAGPRVAKTDAPCTYPGDGYRPGPYTVKDRSRLRDPVPVSRPVSGVSPQAGAFAAYSSVCVTVSFDVDPDGTTARVQVMFAEPAGADTEPFRAAAAASVRRWRYRPGTLDGRKVIYPQNVAAIIYRDDGTARVE